MNWELIFLPEAVKDLKKFDRSQQLLILKSIKKVQTNPLPIYEGGYGKPLGNKGGNKLTGFLKIKLKDAGIRVVYKLIKTKTQMMIVVIGARADDEVYEVADKRIEKNNL
ncbi:MAG: type II toxin-antitoxin system RelE/ParE family toxin [Clostridia bacterium]|nr:type II toxin-antitoxin system RelE/ParE family toxin [Clostridia bacterium]